MAAKIGEACRVRLTTEVRIQRAGPTHDTVWIVLEKGGVFPAVLEQAAYVLTVEVLAQPHVWIGLDEAAEVKN